MALPKEIDRILDGVDIATLRMQLDVAGRMDALRLVISRLVGEKVAAADEESRRLMSFESKDVARAIHANGIKQGLDGMGDPIDLVESLYQKAIESAQ